MLEIIKSYLSKESFYIINTKEYLYIKNYKEIISINDKQLTILIDKYKYIIEGNNLKIKKKINKEIILKGNIETIIKYDNN